MAKTYRTANGGKVDLGALILSNENTRAAGNMGVNARGDKINSQNEVIETRNEQIQRAYDMTVNNQPVDELPPTSAKHAKKLEKERALHEKREMNPEAVKQRPPKEELRKMKGEEIKTPASMDTMPEHVQSPNTDPSPLPVQEKVVQPAQTLKRVPQGGLAAAIAKAKEIKEEPEKTARQMQQEQSGVKRI